MNDGESSIAPASFGGEGGYCPESDRQPLPLRYPYPPWCPVYGWWVSKGGAVRMLDVRITLRYPPAATMRQWLARAGARVAPCRWYGGEVVDCIRYGDALKVVEVATGGRDPPNATGAAIFSELGTIGKDAT